MENEKITIPIGSDKALVFNLGSNKKEDLEFAEHCQEVAATEPQSIQEFFTRLNNLQKNKTLEKNKKNSRKI